MPHLSSSTIYARIYLNVHSSPTSWGKKRAADTGKTWKIRKFDRLKSLGDPSRMKEQIAAEKSHWYNSFSDNWDSRAYNSMLYEKEAHLIHQRSLVLFPSFYWLNPYQMITFCEKLRHLYKTILFLIPSPSPLRVSIVFSSFLKLFIDFNFRDLYTCKEESQCWKANDWTGQVVIN